MPTNLELGLVGEVGGLCVMHGAEPPLRVFHPQAPKADTPASLWGQPGWSLEAASRPSLRTLLSPSSSLPAEPMVPSRAILLGTQLRRPLCPGDGGAWERCPRRAGLLSPPRCCGGREEAARGAEEMLFVSRPVEAGLRPAHASLLSW